MLGLSAAALLWVVGARGAGPAPVVAWDARLESLGAATLLAGPPWPAGFVDHGGVYARRVRADLQRWNGHAVLGLSRGLDPRGFDYRARVETVHRLTADLGRDPGRPIDDNLAAAAGGKTALEYWLSGLRAFARDAGIPARAPPWAALVDPGLTAARAALDRRRVTDRILRYTGVPFEGSYRIMGTPYLDPKRMVNSVWLRDDGSYDLFSVFGLGAARDPAGYFLTERLPVTAWHQLAHGTLDLFADLYSDEIPRGAKAYGSLPFDCEGPSLQCFKENIVRAVYIRLTAREIGEAAAARLLRDEPAAHFPRMPRLLKLLGEYEANRKRYPSLGAFFPRLIAAFGPARDRPLNRQLPDLQRVEAMAHPFRTAGQRRRALAALDRLIAAGPRASFLRKRAAIRALLGLRAGAADDAAALRRMDADDDIAGAVFRLGAAVNRR